ncbi:chaplin [Kitasatospora sp. RB6PN24]|uniref:chaplin n=1 Tax=Kitasatospora humi TaxID=2893891 RepID=UPI001E32AB97|nr:chaplin [Kitasatospora humi]MCC9311616.1 chaplin [Kitasatospora humi]
MNAKKVAALSTATLGLVIGGAGSALASAGAEGVAAHSPGVLSGNAIQVPVHIPINLCGDSVNVIGLLNPAFGNTCINNDVHVQGHAQEQEHGEHGEHGDHDHEHGDHDEDDDC